jgi:hypothetical protein
VDSIIIFRNLIQSWRFATIAIIFIGVRGLGDNKSEKQLLFTHGEGEFDENIFVLNNNFRLKYEQLLQAYIGGQCGMVLIKNVTTTSKGN